MLRSSALTFRLSALLFWSALVLPGQAQQAAPALPKEATAPSLAAASGAAKSPANLPAIPCRPVSHVLDESGMFPAAAAKTLSARLLSSQTRTGLGLYLCIHTYLADETADIRARRTHAAWIEGQGAGIIVVHDRSTGRLSFAGSDDKRMPDEAGLRALYRLADSTAKALPPEAEATARLAATLTTLADGLEAWQKNGRLPAPPVVTTQARPAADPSAPPPLRPPWTRPGTFFIDEAAVFTDPAATAALRQRLEAWHTETGLRLYVVSVTYPPENSGMPLAEKLVMEWLPETMGGVIVYDRSRPDTLTFAGTPQADRWLSPVQLKTLHEDALAAARAAGADPAARLEAAAAYLTTAYARDGLPILRDSQQWLPRTQRRYLPWILGGFAACAAILYLFHRWQERADRRRATFLFPEVFVPERLGALHGGGVTAEIITKPEAVPHPPH